MLDLLVYHIVFYSYNADVINVFLKYVKATHEAYGLLVCTVDETFEHFS
jgi:hypothetical protein